MGCREIDLLDADFSVPILRWRFSANQEFFMATWAFPRN